MRMRGVDPAAGMLITAEHAAFLKCCRGSRSIPAVTTVWPRYELVVYRGPEELPERIEYFLKHEDQRQELARQMRVAVLENFTYDAVVRNVLAFVRHALTRAGESSCD